MKTLIVIVTAASLSGTTLAQVNPSLDGRYQAEFKVAQASSSRSDGEVRKVDMDAKKLTVRHGPLENLGMPPMTMVFQVKDPAMLDKVKAGDKIKFVADKVGGTYTISELEVVK